MSRKKILTCPLRGDLTTSALARDGLTVSEESRRIDFINFLLRRKYPEANIAVETVVIKNLGESGRNKVRCDVIVYKRPVAELEHVELEERLKGTILIAEIKRDSRKKESGIANQLEPALIQAPAINVLGAYWDDVSKILFIKKMVKSDEGKFIEIERDSLENLPAFGRRYQSKPLTISNLSKPDDLMGLLYSVANIMRSHGVNDDQVRYKETVKLILARYCDEREAKSKESQEISLQVLPGDDIGFLKRVQKYYTAASNRYKRAKNLFQPQVMPELEERTVREIIRLVQGVAFNLATIEAMQQVFQSFVPAVFKKNLDQYFTPNTLIETIVGMVSIGPLDTVADPAMGTGDFLTGAMDCRIREGDDDIMNRVFGMDVDSKAYDLAVINMILNKDGQSNLSNVDSIEKHAKWAEEINIALCNPPFGEKSLEKRASVLKNYDLGHVWQQSDEGGSWSKTNSIMAKQQLGILFIERCYKLLPFGGRLGIILPEGYLCTNSYGYVRTWLLEKFRIISMTELPRRIFLKSNADLRANVVIAQKLSEEDLQKLKRYDYPIHTEIVRKVGYKLGKGYSIIPARDEETGEEVRDDQNEVIIDTDFSGANRRFEVFQKTFKVFDTVREQVEVTSKWAGGSYSNIATRSDLDMKPRRLAIRAIENIDRLRGNNHVRLGDIADISNEYVDVGCDDNRSSEFRLILGQDIRATEGIVIPQYPQRGWKIAEAKTNRCFSIRSMDIIIGLVRPERRNIGIVLHEYSNLVGAPDGIAVIRLKKGLSHPFTQNWLFSTMRAESSRLQFWTESGGTSYGKLNSGNILNLLLPKPGMAELNARSEEVGSWLRKAKSSMKLWDDLWNGGDNFPILNSPVFGLEPPD